MKDVSTTNARTEARRIIELVRTDERNQRWKDGEQPIPLEVTAPLPPFPLGALPRSFAAMVAAVAEFTQTDPGMAGTSALTVISAAVGGHVEVEVRPG